MNTCSCRNSKQMTLADARLQDAASGIMWSLQSFATSLAHFARRTLPRRPSSRRPARHES